MRRRPASPRRRGCGIAYLPRDRRATGIFPGQSVFDNFAIAALPRHARLGFVRRGPLRQRLAAFRDRLSMVYGAAAAPIGTLSGGNQQKVLLARWLACEPRLLLLNDPTRGVDLGTRLKLYEVFRGLARDDGIPLVVLSSEIEEILQLCDRVLVFREQGVVARTGRERAHHGPRHRRDVRSGGGGVSRLLGARPELRLARSACASCCSRLTFGSTRPASRRPASAPPSGSRHP